MEGPRTAMVLAPPPPPIAVPPMHPFLEHPGEPPEQWAHWIAQFDTFWTMVTIGRGSSYTDQDKSRYLELMLGMEGRRLVRHTPGALALETSSHDTYRTAVRDILVPKTSPFRAIATFLARKQRLGETIQQYMADLRDLAAKCPFTVGEEDFWVASALAIGCQSERARERLFTLDKVDLGRVVDILLSDQSVRADLQATQTGSVGAFQQRQMARGRGRGGASRGRGRGSGGAAAAPQSRTPPTCGNCGGSHVTNAEGCLAQGKTCHRCGRVGHLKKFCRGAPAVKQVGGVVEPLAFNQDQGGYVGGVGSGAAEKYTATLDAWTGKLWTPVTWEVDTGASVTTLRMADVEALQLYLPLHPPKPLYLYDRTKMSGIRGTINLSVRLGQRTADTEVYVVQNQCSSVIGRDLLGKLNVTIKCAEGQIQALKAGPVDPVRQFPKLFSKTVGTFPNYQHRIQVDPEAAPRVTRLRTIPLARRQAVMEEIRKMDRDGIWEPVQRSQWVHGLVTVAKNTGGVRITTDLSPLNPHILPETHPLPAIKDLMVDLHGAKLFSKMDMKKGFFHIRLHPDSRGLTTTVTPLGLRQYTRLPMGLKESSAVFQRLVAQALAGLQGVVAYIDDILVFGKTEDQHDQCLRAVLERLQEHDFRLALDKCQFRVEQVTFLGHLIGVDGVRPDPKNLKGIEECREPANPREVMTFLGMVDFYRDFIEDVTSLAEPLRKLTRKGIPWEWGWEQDLAFNTLKKTMTEKLRVHLFDPAAPTILTTDASDIGVGAALSQIQKGREVPIAFASSSLSPAQRNYSASEREAWAVVWACEHWEKFLVGRPFDLRTDHSALQTMMTARGTRRESSKFHRWLERLTPFNFKPIYIRGTDNKVADALSRLGARSKAVGVDLKRNVMGTVSTEACAKAMVEDPSLYNLKQYLTNGWPNQGKLSGDLCNLFKERAALTVRNGCVYRDGRIFIPSALRNEVLKDAHKGHPGIVRLKRLLREGVFWPGMAKDAEQWVRGCSGCTLSDKSKPVGVHGKAPIPPPKEPGVQWGVDICGPFFNGQSLLVAVDHATGWPEILSRARINAGDVARWLDQDIFARYGLPNAIITDNGPQFAAKEFQDFLKGYDVHHSRTAVYTPTENGIVERFNRVIKTTVQAEVVEGRNWQDTITEILRSYRATPRAGGKSPAEQFLGRKIRAPFMPNPEQPARRTEKQAEEAWKDKGARFQPGDRVGTRLPQREKGLPGYQGPKTVERVLGRYTFILSDGKKWGFRKLTAWPEGYPPFVPAPGSDAVGARTKEGTAQRQTVRRSQRQRREPQRFDSLQERKGIALNSKRVIGNHHGGLAPIRGVLWCSGRMRKYQKGGNRNSFLSPFPVML